MCSVIYESNRQVHTEWLVSSSVGGKCKSCIVRKLSSALSMVYMLALIIGKLLGCHETPHRAHRARCAALTGQVTKYRTARTASRNTAPRRENNYRTAPRNLIPHRVHRTEISWRGVWTTINTLTFWPQGQCTLMGPAINHISRTVQVVVC